jgi:hypothetical protein
MMQEIEALAQRGWRVIPCTVKGKKPLIKNWPRLASSDALAIRRWAEQHPGCNWGVVTGAESGVFVVDIDGEEGRASLAALEAQHGALPVTLMSRSGRLDGGEHRWFNYPVDRWIRSSTGTVSANLDIQSDGKHVIVSPSIHHSGRPYQWLNPEHPVVDAPGWLLDLLKGKGGNRNAQSTFSGVLFEGKRNNGLFRHGCGLRRMGWTLEQIEAELLNINARKCMPPLPAKEVHQIAASAAKYPPGGPDPLVTAWAAVLKEQHAGGYEQFLALARHLQLARLGRTIALPVVRIGALMCRDWTQIRRWRQRAVRDGWLHCINRSLWLEKRASLFVYSNVPLASDVPLISGVPLAKDRCPQTAYVPLSQTADVPLGLTSLSGLVGHHDRIGASVPDSTEVDGFVEVLL